MLRPAGNLDEYQRYVISSRAAAPVRDAIEHLLLHLARTAVAVKSGGRHCEIRRGAREIADHEMIQMAQHRPEFRTAFDLGHCFRVDAIGDKR